MALRPTRACPLQRIDLKQFDAETAVSFDPEDGAEAAGIVLHSTVAFNVMFSLTRTGDGKVIELASYTGASRIDGADATRNTLATVPVRRHVGPSQGQLRRNGERDVFVQRRRLHLAGHGRAGQRGA